MAEIKKIALSKKQTVHDIGAKMSDYSDVILEHNELYNLCAYKFGGGRHPRLGREMQEAVKVSTTFIFVGLVQDFNGDLPNRCIYIDKGADTLKQVIQLLYTA